MWRHIGNPKNKLADPPIDRLVLKLAYVRSLMVPFIFLTMLPIAYFTNVFYAVWIPTFTPLIIRIVRKRMTKKHELAIARQK
jgi:hypothetical protein